MYQFRAFGADILFEAGILKELHFKDMRSKVFSAGGWKYLLSLTNQWWPIFAALMLGLACNNNDLPRAVWPLHCIFVFWYFLFCFDCRFAGAGLALHWRKPPRLEPESNIVKLCIWGMRDGWFGSFCKARLQQNRDLGKLRSTASRENVPPVHTLGLEG